jgi:putative two-component system response regulator
VNPRTTLASHAPTHFKGSCFRLISSAFTSLNFRRNRFITVFLTMQNLPFRLTAQICVKPRITMKQHTLIGAQILKESEIEVIRMAESIALTHHERWDGKGYPQGLQGEAIPLAGRIVAVADVLDALCSKRPYREAPIYPMEKVYAMIQEGRGTQFDPLVVDALMAIRNEIQAIKNNHVDKDVPR